MPTHKLVNNLPILNKTIAHWDKVEIFLGQSVQLPGGVSHDEAIDLASALQTVETSLIDQRTTLASAQKTRTLARTSAHTAARQARKSIRGLAKDLPEAAALPDLPAANSAPATLIALYTEIASVWERLNGLPATAVPTLHLPLRIPLDENGAFVHLPLAQFRERIANLHGAAESLAAAESTVTESLAERNDLHVQAATIVKNYGAAARAVLPESNKLLKSIPTLSGG